MAVVADGRAKLERPAPPHEHGQVGVAHAIGQGGEDRGHRLFRRTCGRQENTDRLDAAEGLLASADVRDIDTRADQVRGVSVVIKEADIAPGDQTEAPIAGHPVVLICRRRLAGTQRGQILPDGLDLGLGHQELVERAALHLLEGVAGDQLAGAVEPKNPALAVEDRDQGAGDIKHGIHEPPLFALLVAFLDERGDVRDRSDVAGDRAVERADRSGLAGCPEGRAVRPDDAELQRDLRPGEDRCLPRGDDDIAVVGVDRFRPAVPERRLGRPAAVGDPARVDVAAGSIGVRLEDRRRDEPKSLGVDRCRIAGRGSCGRLAGTLLHREARGHSAQGRATHVPNADSGERYGHRVPASLARMY